MGEGQYTRRMNRNANIMKTPWVVGSSRRTAYVNQRPRISWNESTVQSIACTRLDTKVRGLPLTISTYLFRTGANCDRPARKGTVLELVPHQRVFLPSEVQS